MVSIPNFEQLKEMCGSDEIKDCFKFLFIQEEAENEGSITKVTEWCEGLHQKIGKFAELIEEGRSFSYFDVPAMDGMECLMEAQARNDVILQALAGLLNALREAKPEKRRHVMVMEVHD
ncbi:hypothetical protein CTI12_AA288860 [Artemisia annua]|uniref:Uncharacterized protein n=1 Tax=Artemisia annua TaxID=35608 RepID=A0A2U1NA86_ARTAN|nr:hypothetical protein CTI12_AA288860 [Artemisia annua]